LVVGFVVDEVDDSVVDEAGRVLEEKMLLQLNLVVVEVVGRDVERDDDGGNVDDGNDGGKVVVGSVGIGCSSVYSSA